MADRSTILSLFDDYEARFPDESTTVERIRRFVENHPDCFERSLKTGHITGSAWVLDRQRQRVLLTHHRKLNIWVQLGGHADGESDVSVVAMKEATEESGIADLQLADSRIFDIDIHAIPARGDEPEHYHYDCRFLIQTTSTDDYVVSEESHDLAWVPLTEVSQLSDEASLLRMVRKTTSQATTE
ncbi:MAG: NUDIX hydrolase [Pseudomonadales bacterium]|nr:NUDIX hydrolase [Pseudomonadales bacterium]